MPVIPPTRRDVAVVAECCKTGKKTTYTSFAECAKAIGSYRGVVSKATFPKRDGTRRVVAGHFIKELD